MSNIQVVSTAEQIIHKIAALRPEKRTELLEFVELLKEQDRKNKENDLGNASLSAAMRGMEDEESLYTESDIIEKIG